MRLIRLRPRVKMSTTRRYLGAGNTRDPAEMPTTFDLRRAIPADAEIVGWHRARMFQHMGSLPEELFDAFAAQSTGYLREGLADETYLGWLVPHPDQPDANHWRWVDPPTSSAFAPAGSRWESQARARPTRPDR